jgi:hypothetical protein
MTAHALMIDPDAPAPPQRDEWFFETSPYLIAEDGTELGLLGTHRLWCRYQNGKIVITDIQAEQWLSGKSHWICISSRRDALSQEICAAIRRRYSQRDLEDRYVDAVEEGCS